MEPRILAVGAAEAAEHSLVGVDNRVAEVGSPVVVPRPEGNLVVEEDIRVVAEDIRVVAEDIRVVAEDIRVVVVAVHLG